MLAVADALARTSGARDPPRPKAHNVLAGNFGDGGDRLGIAKDLADLLRARAKSRKPSATRPR
jgi:hypothetical protein